MTAAQSGSLAGLRLAGEAPRVLRRVDQQVAGVVAPVAEAGEPEPLAPVLVPGTVELAEPVPWPGEAALGAFEPPEIGGLLAGAPEAVVVGAGGAGAV
jgi:hypothetical protein